jgi:LPS export ABC transporter permease LptG/LPS export ABC transporter permease LptF
MKRFRPNLIWRYTFKEILSPTVLGLLVYVMVFLMNAMFELAELAIKKDLPFITVAHILFYYLPRVLVLTIPMAILLGVLVGVGRLSTDSEVVALRASGVSYWRLLSPALTLGLIGWLLGSYLIIQVEPKANYSRHQVMRELTYSADPRREIKARVFFEDLPGLLLYAEEVHQNGDFLERLFLHQSDDQGQELVTMARRAQIDYDPQDGVAHFYLESGMTHALSPDDPEGYQVSQFERQMLRMEPDEAFRIKTSLLTRPAQKGWREQNLAELARSILKAGAITHEETRNRVIGSILAIVHQRFALPVACLVFALLGVPLGILNRRGGKASGFSLSIGIAIIYWILLSTGENLVRQGKLSPYIGLWIGNVLFGMLGVTLFFLRERSEKLQLSLLVPAPLQRALTALRRREEEQIDAQRRSDGLGPTLDIGSDRPPPERRLRRFRFSRRRLRSRKAPRTSGARPAPLRALEPDNAAAREDGGSTPATDSEPGPRDNALRWRAILIGTLIVAGGIASISFSPFLVVALTLLALVLIFSTTVDRYVLHRFSVTLGGCLIVLLTLFCVYEFSDLLDDLVERELGIAFALNYLKYRIPWILAQILPMSALVATFLTFAIMSRFNEVTALKAGGTSIYRLSMPILLMMISLSTLAFVNHDYLMPFANQKARQIKDVIRGKKPRSYQSKQQRWIFGEGPRLFNFNHYAPPLIPVLPMGGGGVFQGFSTYRLDPASFEIRERIYARTATYERDGWTLKDGWMREFQDGREAFETFVEKRFDFPEKSSDFITEWKRPEQMNYAELSGFMKDLRKRGYDVQELAVDLHAKMALPLVSLTMVILGLPFCFRMGRRGSLYGIGIATVLVGVFLLIFAASNALGGVGLIPPVLAAWAPNILFAGSGVYLLLRTPT